MFFLFEITLQNEPSVKNSNKQEHVITLLIFNTIKQIGK